MPPRKAPARKPRRVLAIPPKPTSGRPKNGVKLLWGDQYQNLIIEAVALALRDSKLELWKRIKRNPKFFPILNRFTPAELKTQYNTIMQQDSDASGFYINHRILPMMKVQRSLQLPVEFLSTTVTGAIQAPFYGPRYGQADSDNEFPDPQTESYKTTKTINGKTTPVQTKSITLQQLEGMGTPGFLVRVEAATIRTLQDRLRSFHYQAVLMKIRMDHKKATNEDLDPVAIPQVDGIKYVSLPPPPMIILPYLRDEELDQMQLLSYDYFFPTIQDEYRYLFQQFFHYYTHRERPFSFAWHQELYQSMSDTLLDYYYNGYSVPIDPNNPPQNDAELDIDQQNAARTPRYSPSMASFKTYLNNILGIPLWYAITIVNFFSEFQLPQHFSPDPIPPLVQQHLHSYQRQIFNIIINQHFARYPTSFAPIPTMDNAKERYQQMFVGGGRHFNNTSAITKPLADAYDAQGQEEYDNY